MRVFSSLILILSFQFSFACGGWEVPSEVYRLSMFNAQRTNFFPGLSIFYYPADSYYKEFGDFDTDSKLNCLEWKQKLGNHINSNDVYIILYKTSSSGFIKAHENKTLHKVFKNNTFIKALLLPKNKVFLDYLLMAKKQESDDWNGTYLLNVDECKRKISQTKDFFLKQRYAFLLLRKLNGCDKIEEENFLYNTYFKNRRTVLDHSAMYYRAVYVNNGDTLRNYLLSKAFMKCGDKAFKTYSQYNSSLIKATLSLAKNNDERSDILGMQYLKNPSPCLEGLKKIARVSPNNILLSFLIRREVNKLEDWILTPEYTNEVPAVTFNYYETWNKDYEKAKKENYAKDILYLKEFRNFLISIHKRTIGEQRDYVSAAIAQLCFIDNEIELGKKYANMISNKANLSLQMQKNIQLALVILKKDDLKDEEVKNKLSVYLNNVEKIAKQNSESNKSLYSLYRVASMEFSKHGNQALAGLLYIKAEIAKSHDAGYEDIDLGHYDYLGYFERHASIKDADYLIALSQKHNKTSFEKLISKNALSKDVNLYKDLKGTIAFRNNDLQLAYKVFASMPSNFWTKDEYLNEDPFIPKALVRTQDRKLNYHFNKADFIKKIMELKKQNTAESYVQLANAYYNVSYFGNSWMMVSYDRFNIPSGNPYFTYCDNNQDLKAKYQNGNYYDLTIAKMYYQKALEIAKTNEEKALASLMIFRCKYDRYDFSDFNSYDLTYFPKRNKMKDQYPFYYEYVYPYYETNNEKFRGIQELINFYSIYKSTETFKKYDCPLLSEFIN